MAALKQSKFIADLSSLLYSFLPGSGAIYTFADVAEEMELRNFWIGGSKLPAIRVLLERTLSKSEESFKPLILTVVREGFKYRDKKGVPLTCQEIEKLNSILSKLGKAIPELCDKGFLESLEISKPQETFLKNKYLKLFDTLSFHPKITKTSRNLYADGHYAQAIFEAFKAVNNYVKKKSGKKGLDGQKLMAQVFNNKKPMVRLNRLITQSDKDEQRGFQFIYMGAMTGIRNPKAHDHVEQRDPIRTLKYLALASLLIEKAEEGKVNKRR